MNARMTLSAAALAGALTLLVADSAPPMCATYDTLGETHYTYVADVALPDADHPPIEGTLQVFEGDPAYHDFTIEVRSGEMGVDWAGLGHDLGNCDLSGQSGHGTLVGLSMSVTLPVSTKDEPVTRLEFSCEAEPPVDGIIEFSCESWSPDEFAEVLYATLRLAPVESMVRGASHLPE